MQSGKGARASGLRTETKKTLSLLTLAAPAIILIFIFNYIPMFGTFIAFKEINVQLGIFKSPWVGFKNFEFFFASNDALTITRNTILYNIAFIIVGHITALAFAMMLNEVQSRRVTKFYQTVFFFPYFFSWVIVSYMVYSFFAPRYGILVNALKPLGVDLGGFYTTLDFWPGFLIFMNVWKGLGYNSIVYYAGIMGISHDYYEAAEIDGATGLQCAFFITLPLLAPLITILVLLAIGNIFYSDFGLFYFVPREIGRLIPVTQVIDTYVYRALKNSGNISMAAAVGLYQSLVGFILVVISNMIVRRYSPENSLF